MRPILVFDGNNKFLSNFYQCDVEFEGVVYPSAEHAYQASKTDIISERAWIVSAPTPAKAKQIGRMVTLRENWRDVRETYMYQILKTKFSNPRLKKRLLSTGTAFLEEGNSWHDCYWGNCSCSRCENIEGQNRLGNILMQIRQELKED